MAERFRAGFDGAREGIPDPPRGCGRLDPEGRAVGSPARRAATNNVAEYTGL
jgi:hypothetical protein